MPAGVEVAFDCHVVASPLAVCYRTGNAANTFGAAGHITQIPAITDAFMCKPHDPANIMFTDDRANIIAVFYPEYITITSDTTHMDIAGYFPLFEFLSIIISHQYLPCRQ